MVFVLTHISFPPVLPRLTAALLVAFFSSGNGRAEQSVVLTFDLHSDEAEPALKLFSRQSGRQMIFASKLVTGIRTHEVRGQYTAVAALERMLAGTPVIAAEDATTGAFAIVARPAKTRPPLNAAALVVIGLTADPEQAKRLRSQAESARDVLAARGIPSGAIELFPPSSSGVARRDAILAGLRAVKPTLDETWLVLLGQAAAGRDDRPAFQVSGPRLSVDDLTSAIAALPGKKFVVFATGKSGGFLPALLALPEVEAVAATADNGEINEPRFVQMWIDALAANPDASFRELAVEAAARVETYYRDHRLGQGEHAQLIDRAAGKIIEAPFNATTSSDQGAAAAPL